MVIGTPAYDANDLPAVVQVHPQSGNSFNIRVINPSGSSLSGYTVHLMIVEAGYYRNVDTGLVMEARTVPISQTDNSSSWTGVETYMGLSYSDPVVLGQVITDADDPWSVFWARSTTLAGDAPSNGSLKVGRHQGADRASIDAGEVALVVIESGQWDLGKFNLQAGLGADTVAGVDNDPAYRYTIQTATGALGAVASSAGMDGSDGGWPILYGDNPVTIDHIDFAIDEDQVGDSERGHTTEQVAWLVVETDNRQRPVARAGDNRALTEGDPVTLSAATSSDGDGTIVDHLWKEGQTVLGTSETLTYTPTVGTHTITLEVTDDDGYTDTDTLILSVEAESITRRVTMDPIPGYTWSAIAPSAVTELTPNPTFEYEGREDLRLETSPAGSG